jgi:hypothetical protein
VSKIEHSGGGGTNLILAAEFEVKRRARTLPDKFEKLVS